MTGGSEVPLKIAAVVLAAGASVRMGQPKQLLPIAGQPMVRRVTEAVCAVGLAQVVVVVGAHAGDVQQALAGMPVEFVTNQAWTEGLGASMRVGVGALSPEIEAALVVLADQPALTPGLIQTLVVRYRESGAPIVAPFCKGQRGNPVLFDRSLFAELRQVAGDQGGRALLERYLPLMERVETEDPAVLLDVDTQQDYEVARRLATGQEQGSGTLPPE